MRTAGFKSSNAAAQSGVALALEDLLRLLLKSQDSLFVFGSFCDGWGSCLSKIDGSIDSDSDIDITFVLKSNSVHITADCSASETSQCLEGCMVAEYEDGHVSYQSKESTPSLPLGAMTYACRISTLFLLGTAAAIPASSCCRPATGPTFRHRLLEAIRTEVLQVPRCHAVSASPPGLEGSRMRVSTTLLERIVMHNLSTVQGQLFVLLKFFIKRHISSKVSGLKTYMAKNLLFYMLDETPVEDWRPENLLSLLKQSLEMLVAMMESFDNEEMSDPTQAAAADRRLEAVCMRHFFLRDAVVYLKKDHADKRSIVTETKTAIDDIQKIAQVFEAGLTKNSVRVVHLHIALQPLIYFADVMQFSKGEMNFKCKEIFGIVWEIQSLMHREATPIQCQPVAPEDFARVLQKISELEGCHEVVKKCLTMMAHYKVGMPIGESRDQIFDEEFGGVLCPEGDSTLSVKEGKAAVMKLLQRCDSLGIEVCHDRICAVRSLQTEIWQLFQVLSTFLKNCRRSSLSTDTALHVLDFASAALLATNFPFPVFRTEGDGWRSSEVNFARNILMIFCEVVGTEDCPALRDWSDDEEEEALQSQLTKSDNNH
uniref:Mab-21 domain-containing protein n=2 Tax=Macrostomum lignano TaxID=282301 RepID=A0A1I8H961_9PLAT